MHKKFLVRDHDIFYLSYDEPNAEKNYADICNKIPWVKRVHGVKGSDAAHKACAERAETERFEARSGNLIKLLVSTMRPFPLKSPIIWTRSGSKVKKCPEAVCSIRSCPEAVDRMFVTPPPIIVQTPSNMPAHPVLIFPAAQVWHSRQTVFRSFVHLDASY